MRTYQQLTREQRYQIYALKKMEHNPTEMAKVLEVNESTISRELQRNRGERGSAWKTVGWVSIEERPQLVEQRERLGDWEADTLIGKGHRGALVSLVE